MQSIWNPREGGGEDVHISMFLHSLVLIDAHLSHLGAAEHHTGHVGVVRLDVHPPTTHASGQSSCLGLWQTDNQTDGCLCTLNSASTFALLQDRETDRETLRQTGQQTRQAQRYTDTHTGSWSDPAGPTCGVLEIRTQGLLPKLSTFQTRRHAEIGTARSR